MADRSWDEAVCAGSVAEAHAVRTAGTHTSFVTAAELDSQLSA